MLVVRNHGPLASDPGPLCRLHCRRTTILEDTPDAPRRRSDCIRKAAHSEESFINRHQPAVSADRGLARDAISSPLMADETRDDYDRQTLPVQLRCLSATEIMCRRYRPYLLRVIDHPPSKGEIPPPGLERPISALNTCMEYLKRAKEWLTFSSATSISVCHSYVWPVFTSHSLY